MWSYETTSMLEELLGYSCVVCKVRVCVCHVSARGRRHDAPRAGLTRPRRPARGIPRACRDTCISCLGFPQISPIQELHKREAAADTGGWETRFIRSVRLSP